MPTANNQPWHIEFVATLAGEESTKTTLDIQQPLKAGTLRIIRCRLGRQGEVIPITQDIGSSVDLDWHGGGDIEIEI